MQRKPPVPPSKATIREALCYLNVRSSIYDDDMFKVTQRQLPLEKDNGLWMTTYIDDFVVNNCLRANIEFDIPEYIMMTYPKIRELMKGPRAVFTDMFWDRVNEKSKHPEKHYNPYFLHFCKEPNYDKCKCKFTFLMAQDGYADPTDYKKEHKKWNFSFKSATNFMFDV